MRGAVTILMWVCVIAWAGLAIEGVLTYLSLEPTGSSFTRGTNRINAFLGWGGLCTGCRSCCLHIWTDGAKQRCHSSGVKGPAMDQRRVLPIVDIRVRWVVGLGAFVLMDCHRAQFRYVG